MTFNLIPVAFVRPGKHAIRVLAGAYIGWPHCCTLANMHVLLFMNFCWMQGGPKTGQFLKASLSSSNRQWAGVHNFRLTKSTCRAKSCNRSSNCCGSKYARSRPHPASYQFYIASTGFRYVSKSFSRPLTVCKPTLWGKKTAPFYFCNNFVKTFYSEIIICTYILQ